MTRDSIFNKEKRNESINYEFYRKKQNPVKTKQKLLQNLHSSSQEVKQYLIPDSTFIFKGERQEERHEPLLYT